MADFPTGHLPPHRVISTLSSGALGIGISVLVNAAPASTNWPVAFRIIYVPLLLNAPFLVARFFWANGTPTTLNVEAGLYSQSGVRLATTGSLAQSGPSNTQSAAPSGGSFMLPPGFYYLALTLESASARIFRISTTTIRARELNVFEQTLAGWTGLPATTPFGINASGYIPICGISEHTLI